jgi:hypothetical protein
LTEEHGEYNKSLAKTCISIASAYYQLNNYQESVNYFEKAERIFKILGNSKIVKEIQQKKEQLLPNK